MSLNLTKPKLSAYLEIKIENIAFDTSIRYRRRISNARQRLVWSLTIQWATKQTIECTFLPHKRPLIL